MLFRALWTGTLVKKYAGDGHVLHLGATAFLRPHIHGVAFQDADAFTGKLPGTTERRVREFYCVNIFYFCLLCNYLTLSRNAEECGSLSPSDYNVRQ
jgi:hypothetical protein